jgi:hypothetical protein
VRVGAGGDAGDATALDKDTIGAGVEHRDVSPRGRLQQRLVEEPPIGPRGDPVEHCPERTGERGKYVAGLLGCDLAHLVGRRAAVQRAPLVEQGDESAKGRELVVLHGEAQVASDPIARSRPHLLEISEQVG